MKSCENDGDPLAQPRSHPWTDSTADSSFRYYDFKAQPALIRTALEDLHPWGHYAAITALYELLERVNAPGSILESNDCALSAPHPSEAPQMGAMQVDGRVMVLFRELERNLLHPDLAKLTYDIHVALASHDPDFEQGMVGTTITPVRYLGLSGADDRNLGHQLMLSFWAWGGSETEVMDNLDRVVKNLARAVAVATTTDALAARPDGP